MTDMSEVYLSWRPPEPATPLEQALVDWWVTGKMADVLVESVQPATLAWLRGASRHQREHSQAHLLADAIFKAAPDPILIVASDGRWLGNSKLEVLLKQDAAKQGKYVFADRTSALQPVLNIIQSAQRISRRNLVVPMGGKAFSVTILLPLDDQSTIVNFRELDLRLPDVTPLVQSILLLRFAGLKAKEVAFVLERPANTVNACMKKHAEALSRLFRESL